MPLLEKLGEPLFLLDQNPTAENIARLIYEYTPSQGIPTRRVEVVGDAELLRQLSRLIPDNSPAYPRTQRQARIASRQRKTC